MGTHTTSRKRCFRCSRIKMHTRPRIRTTPGPAVDLGISALPQPAWDPLAQAICLLGWGTWGAITTRTYFSFRSPFFTPGCVRAGGGGGIWQQGAEEQERTEAVFCSAPWRSPALVHLLCNPKLPVSNIIYGNAQAEPKNQETKSSFPDVILHPGF